MTHYTRSRAGPTILRGEAVVVPQVTGARNSDRTRDDGSIDQATTFMYDGRWIVLHSHKGLLY